MLRRLVALLAAASLLAATGCGSASEAAPGKSGLSGTLTVSAAASLTETFTALGDSFMADNPGVDLKFNFGASSALAQQITDQAPVDVFASADEKTMKTVSDASDSPLDPEVFVTNVLVIAVPKGNRAGVTDLRDFADEQKKIALCAAEVPCGAAAQTVLDRAGVTPQPDTLEKDVKAALAKVKLNEVDAALVYRTDALAAKDSVDMLEFPQSSAAVNKYPIAALPESQNPDAAKAFVEYIMSPAAREVFDDAGFQPPS
ncbi:molybdate ABC transporter substrate-binding protein [Saxibacter everestensis]|uniref:Molybdate ABC transporter substrate-binding protein n=1 Tax=Saxibacter everestensis TaxID=2909229 RepID=A0ABY8QUS0_9MICO|nr:molybdate ABC transporter substrate-binding protein [Brevibacteriaceae bacterium ZFBP1038]